MEKVDIFSDGYYRKNRLCMMASGIWPESSPLTRNITVILVIVSLISGDVPMWCFIYKADNLDAILPLVAHHCTMIVVLTGYLFFAMNMEKIQKIVDHMREDWDIVERSRGIENLPFYAERGALATTIYMVIMYSTSAIFPLYPLTAEILDVISPRNESRVKPLPIDADFTLYGFDNNEDYYYLLLSYEFVILSLYLNALVAVDTFVMISIEHCCGLFKAVGRILQEIQRGRPPKQQYLLIRDAIMIHNRAIALAQTIESNFTIMYGGVLLVSTLSWSLTLLQIILKYQQPSECFIYMAGICGQILHLLSISVPGQELFDHSNQVSGEVYDCNWPDLGPAAKKLISIMMLRTMKPMTITAGGFYLLNIENFGNVIRTSFSIITLMLSVE